LTVGKFPDSGFPKEIPVAHPLTDEVIAEFWPDMANPEGREDIRRQYDALTKASINNQVFGRPIRPISRKTIELLIVSLDEIAEKTSCPKAKSIAIAASDMATAYLISP
jgi:arabinogalactan endo-1,4-beta-galactosidase